MVFELSLVTGAIGTGVGTVCLFVLRKQRSFVESANREMRSTLLKYRAECADQMARLGRDVATLEQSARNTESGGRGGLTRSQRSQAMQLLRSGVPPESAASTL